MKNDLRIDGPDLYIIHRRANGTTQESVLDSADFQIANSIPGRWSIQNGPKRQDGTYQGEGYVTTVIDGKKYYLHHMIKGKRDGHEIDHVDGNSLNNRRENLQWLLPSANKAKMKLSHRPRNNSGLPRGVYPLPSGKYQVIVSGEYIGTFVDPTIAGIEAQNIRTAINFTRLVMPTLVMRAGA